MRFCDEHAKEGLLKMRPDPPRALFTAWPVLGGLVSGK